MALIAGPTASGKSALAVALAKSLIGTGTGALVANADASQVYADLAILSARPTDVDMAEEMTFFAKNQILQQVGTAMLAQANQSSQSILSLLQG